LDRYGARITENVTNVYKMQGAAEAARHITIPCYMPAYFNSHKEEIDAKEKAIGDAERPAHAFIHSALACLARLSSINVPTLVNCGDSDPWCSPRCSEEIARLIPHARLKLYQDSSHFFLNEHFDQVMVDVLEFLGTVKIAAAA
jgi:pimeloyl-ACP methyl ester carboxylesterase